jgi:hypothetical protein
LTEAFAVLGSADPSELGPDELERLADAIWWAREDGRVD